MPPRLSLTPPGCIAAFIGYLLLCLLIYRASDSRWGPGLAAPALLIVLGVGTKKVWGLILLAESRRVLEPQGIRCLVVYSNSPRWENHIRQNWFPRLGERAARLEWSEHLARPSSLEARLFKHFIGAWQHNFNPAVLVFRGLKQPHVYRFYRAFKEANKGRTQYLETLEAEMFSEMGL